MVHRNNRRRRQCRGVIAVLTALMILILAGMVAFAVDYGYLLKVRTDMQRAADAAALAAVQDLIPAADGTQDLARARATARDFAERNLGDPSFRIADADIEIGRFDPGTVYSNVTLLNSGTLDAVRVTLRRDGAINPRVSLFFARALGQQTAPAMASATAVLQKAEVMVPGADVLPFATPADVWDGLADGANWTAYGDGRLGDGAGHIVPGNWGTLDIGPVDNSTSDLVDQILNGLRQEDLNALYADGRIGQDTCIDSSEQAWMNGDPGLSVGIKSAVIAAHGQTRLIPIYDQLGGALTGGNVDFRVVRWGAVTVIGSEWKGAVNTRVTLRKDYLFSGELRPKGDLSGTTSYVEGAYTSPVLVQ